MVIVYLLEVFPNKYSETFVFNEIRMLAQKGHTLYIIASRGHRELFERTEYKFIQNNIYYIYNCSSLLWKVLSSIRMLFKNLFTNPVELAKIIFYGGQKASSPKNLLSMVLTVLTINRMSHIDLIHISFPRIVYLETALLLREKKNIPFTATYRALDIYEKKKDPAYYWSLSSKANKLITISTNNQGFLLKKIGISPDIVHSALDTTLFKRDVGIPKEDRFILTVGRLIPKKGIGYLIQSLDILKKEGNAFSLVIIGRGPLEDHYKSMINKFGLHSHVQIIPSLPPNKIATRMNQASIFVLPCIIAPDGDRDILPNVVKEAMAMELPVITSNVSGIEELIDDEVNGFLVPSADSKALAEKISYVEALDLSQKKRIGTAARKKITKDFAISSEAGKLETIFKEVINGYRT
jgi:glycosyltransferase involved in cell wall biosynthesis